jgi:hypothetical protein
MGSIGFPEMLVRAQKSADINLVLKAELSLVDAEAPTV